MEAASYILDPDDPRAPPQEVWDRMSEQERRRVVDALPSEFPLVAPPEGDAHRRSKERALQSLDEFFRRTRRSVYLSSELPVYYPGERMFAPDVIAVLDVETHERRGWVVADEGKGLDFALEIHAFGSRRKDLDRNVEWFARLRIPEYFVYDPERHRLLGWRLDSGTYVPIIPQEGRWTAKVLGLDLAIGHGRLSFFCGSAELLDARQMIQWLSTTVDDAVRRVEQANEQVEQANEQVEQANERAERLAQRLRQLGFDPDGE